jgi:hypothetical protein
MASTAAPYGLRAVNRVDGLPYAGETRQFLIDPAGYSSNLFYGQVVKIHTDGYIRLVTETGGTGDAFPAGTIGVFVGCSYVNAQGQTVFSQYYPSGSLNAVAYVIDDDRAVFQAQADGPVTQTQLGQNMLFAAAQSGTAGTGGSTTSGNSLSALSATTQALTAGFRLVGFVNGPFSTVGDAKTDVLVKFNIGQHSYTNATGVA